MEQLKWLTIVVGFYSQLKIAIEIVAVLYKLAKEIRAWFAPWGVD